MISENLKIISVIVLYKPDSHILFNLCEVLSSNMISVILMDNSISDKSELANLNQLTGIRIVELFDNLGIARAQNLGINLAIENNADAILFFDQDSHIDSSILNDLIFCISNPEVNVCAPVFIDVDTGIFLPIIKIDKFGLLSKVYDQNNDTDNSLVISSGLLVKLEVFKTVGFMNEDYFIDYVDTDFCFRCFSKNVKITVVEKAVMKHSIGKKMILIFGFHFSIHNPQRVYYQIRNCFIFCRKDYVPLFFKLREIISIGFHQFISLLFFYDKRKHYLKAIFLGLIHGFSGRIGKFSLNLE